MNAEDKLTTLRKELDERIKVFAHKRSRDKNKAFGLKIFAVCFAAAITILLGLKVDDNWANIFKNTALILGALITVLNAVEAFYDHRSLWIRRTMTLARLYALKADLNFYVAGLQDSEMDNKLLVKFMNRYQHILQEDLKAWLKLREGSMPETTEDSSKIKG